MADKRKGDFQIGYGKPPKQTRFKPGQSGNPRGRPSGTRNLKTDLAEELAERIAISEGGRRQAVSKQRGMLKQLMAKALKGDVPPTLFLVSSSGSLTLAPMPILAQLSRLRTRTSLTTFCGVMA